MTKKTQIVGMSDFRAQVRSGASPKGSVVRFVQPGSPIATTEERTVSFVFSDGSVDRYGDTIEAKGWVLDAFNANPVALFGHDASDAKNVIGKAKNVRVAGTQLIGEIEFAEASVNPNAETVYQMVKGGYLNTVSVGFQPLEWVQTKDKSRPGGIDFKKQELWEISVVPVPANPNAVTLARSAGIDVDRLTLLSQSPLPAKTRGAGIQMVKKGLWSVADLAQLILSLGWIVDDARWEAEYEGDGSAVPGMLTEAFRLLGAALVAMTEEEVAEILARFGGDDQTKSFTPAQKFIETVSVAIAAKEKKAGIITRDALSAEDVCALINQKMTDLGVIKAGKALSTANQAIITDACAKMMEAHDCLQGMMIDPADDADDASVEKASALRARKAKALKLRTELAS